MSIVLKPVGGGSSFTFPALPEQIKVKTAAKLQSIDVLSKGTVKFQRGTDVSEVSWDGEFFGPKKQNEPIVQTGAWQEPKTCKKVIERFIEKEKVLNLIITETGLNMDVIISNFHVTAYGAFGNLKYSITFVQKKVLEIYTTNELKIAAFAKKTVPRNDPSSSSSKPAGSSYTIVSGDTLWGIASRKLGSGTKWTSLYNANSSTIEAAAKKHGKKSSDHGHWIYPGTTITIPA